MTTMAPSTPTLRNVGAPASVRIISAASRSSASQDCPPRRSAVVVVLRLVGAELATPPANMVVATDDTELNSNDACCIDQLGYELKRWGELPA